MHKSRKTIKTIEGMPFWQWLKETPVAILEENELPAWKNASQVVEAARSMGATLVRYPAIRWGVHTYDSSMYLPKYPGLGTRNLFGEIFDELKSNGMQVMAYCHYGVLHTHAVATHPEWLSKEADGCPSRWNGDDHHYRACMANELFTHAMKNAICELCGKYEIDALYLDGPTWYGDCRCEHCRLKYQQRYGEAMPEKLSFSDCSQQKYNVIRDDAVEKIVENLRDELSPDLPILFNMTMRNIPTHKTGIPENTNLWAQGGNTTEVHRPGSFWEMYQSVRLGEALENVSMCYLPPGPYETLRNFPMVELDVLAGAYLMHGATPMLGTVSTFLNDKSAGKMMAREVEKFMEFPEVYYRTKPVREIGLIYSRTSGENYAGYDAEKVNKKFGGAFRALLNEHVHFDTFFDTQISAGRLAGYRAIFIPGGISLKQNALDEIRKYVVEGGTLLATGDFSLIDGSGKKLDNFAAADLLGVNFKCKQPEDSYRTREYRETGPLHGYSLIPEAYLKLKDCRISGVLSNVENKLTPASDAQVGISELNRWIDYTIVEPCPETEILADLYLPSGGAFGAPLEFPLGTPPGITLNHYGKGKVIYVAFPLEEFYERRRLPETRNILKELFRILLDREFAVEMDAPPGVIMNLTGNGQQYFLHLLNYTGTMHEDGHAVEYIAPVNNIKINLSEKFGNIKSLRNINTGDFVKNSGGNTFWLNQLEIFCTYIFQ